MLSKHILGSIFGKNLKKIIGLSFLEKSYCEYNHSTIFGKSKICGIDQKNKKVFSHYIEYRLHDYNKHNLIRNIRSGFEFGAPYPHKKGKYYYIDE